MEPLVMRAARGLLGRIVEGRGVAVRLTEVEAHGGPEDPASHAVRRTARSEIMYDEPGRLYVYRSYGLHLCANVVVGPRGVPSAVLLRAGEVVDGIDLTRGRRGSVADQRLARGPGNLAAALGLRIEDNGIDLGAGGEIGLRPDDGRGHSAAVVRTGPRVGVSRAADMAWRCWIDGDPTVSAYRRSPRAPPPAG